MTDFQNSPPTTARSKALRSVIIGTAVIGGLAIASSSVYASLNAQTFNTSPAVVSSDTLKLTMASSAVDGLTGGVTAPISQVAPGDVVNRFLELTNGGTMAGSALKLQLADADPGSTLTSSPTTGLQIAIFECGAQWGADGKCGAGAGTQVMASTPAATLLSTPTAVTVASLAAGTTSHLRLQISLPAGSEVTVNGVLPAGTIQGATSNITWTFTESQRAATTTSN